MTTATLHKKFDTLQLIRGIAVTLVIFHHSYRLLLKNMGYDYKFFDLFEFAALGVDLFFVLSGFIIYYIHRKDIGKGFGSKLKTFLIKRFTRIYPIYWVVSFGFLLMLTIISKKTFSTAHIINSFLLLPDDIQPILGVAWSLRHEMLFYLLFGLLIINRKFLLIFPFWILLIIIDSLGLFTFINTPYFDLLVNPVNIEFLFGCFIAYQLFSEKQRNLQWLIPISIILFIISILLEYQGYLDLHRFISWGIPAFLLILGLVNLETKKSVKVPKLFVFLGDASFSIYLTHIVAIYLFGGVIKVFNIYNFINPVMVVSVCILLQVILGCLFYVIFEKPTINFFKSKLFKKKDIKINKNSGVA